MCIVIINLIFFFILGTGYCEEKIALHTQRLKITPQSIETVLVPGGKSIVGDAASDEKINELPAKIVTISSFEVGIYEITNQQFSIWLNQALKEEKIYYLKESLNNGDVVDNNGNLVFKTFKSDPFSQISFQEDSLNSYTFRSLPGKESYPVIDVSWLGAKMYCMDNHCRLLTEAEWEKAAGMSQTKSGEPLHKFKYGFSQDNIDPKWANYQSNEVNPVHFQGLSTPVGFYNGLNYLPLNTSNDKQEQTHIAVSPCGAYDLSGNVWEWVEDWYDIGYYLNMSEIDPKGPLTEMSTWLKEDVMLAFQLESAFQNA